MSAIPDLHMAQDFLVVRRLDEQKQKGAVVYVMAIVDDVEPPYRFLDAIARAELPLRRRYLGDFTIDCLGAPSIFDLGPAFRGTGYRNLEGIEVRKASEFLSEIQTEEVPSEG